MLDEHQIREVVERGLTEDAPHGDVTSAVFIRAEAVAEAQLVAREPGVFAGADVFRIGMQLRDPEVHVETIVQDGESFTAGTTLATVRGPARSVLLAERVSLNLVQRMSAIATETARYVAAVEAADPPHPVRVVDTRKTTVGLRAIERHAVRCGGGHNHRDNLSEAVMAKDNHLALIDDITGAIRAAREQLPHTTHLEVEVDRIDQIEPVLAGGVDTIMLDNFSPEELVEGVRVVAGRALVEASGGVTLDTIAAIARTGVDLISVGALTHSVRALDLGLDIAVKAPK